MLSEEQKECKLKERQEKHRSMDYKIFNMISELESEGGRSIEYNQLLLALRGYSYKLDREMRQYESRIKGLTLRDELKEMQTALNRERTLRENLEAKVKDATESSGLFIRFVRDKLGV